MNTTANMAATRAARRHSRLALGLAALALLGLSQTAFATTVTCTATQGYWRWGGTGNNFPRLDLTTSPAGSSYSYLDAFRATEAFRDPTVALPSSASRAALDATMDRRFTSGPQPWGVSYSDKRSITLANFVETAGDVDSGFTLGSDCVPAGATILSAKVRVTHAILDPNSPQGEAYAARIRVNDGSGFTAYNLTGANLVNGGYVPSDQIGASNEVTTDSTASPAGAGDVDVSALLNDAAKVNSAVLQFQAMRNGAAMRTLHNEISLIVDYEGGCVVDCTPGGGLTKLVTGGGFVTLAPRKTGNFGFNARSTELGEDVAGSGKFEYNDSDKIQMKGTVDTIHTCAESLDGGSFTFSGTYTGRKGKGGWSSGTFQATVIDSGEPGKGVDWIELSLAPAIGGTIFTGFSGRYITNGNIQFHFCDL